MIDTVPVMIPAGQVVNVHTSAGLEDGVDYAVQNTGKATVFFGEFSAEPASIDGHRKEPGDEFEITADEDKPLYAQAGSSASTKLTISEA